MWVLFIGWVFTRRRVTPDDMFYFGRRLAYVVCACLFATGLIGTGLFTSVPTTTMLLLLTGWIVVPEVRLRQSRRPRRHRRGRAICGELWPRRLTQPPG